MKPKPPGQRARDDEPVFCAETGALISGNPASSNVVAFPHEPRKRTPHESYQPRTVDPGDDI